MMDATALQQDVVVYEAQLADLAEKKEALEAKKVELDEAYREARKRYEDSTKTDGSIMAELEELRTKMGALQRKRDK